MCQGWELRWWLQPQPAAAERAVAADAIMAPEARALGQALEEHLTKHRAKDGAARETQASNLAGCSPSGTRCLAASPGTGVTLMSGLQAGPAAVFRAACWGSFAVSSGGCEAVQAGRALAEGNRRCMHSSWQLLLQMRSTQKRHACCS